MKKCSICKVEKSLAEFHRKSGARDGHRAQCKACLHEHYEKHHVGIKGTRPDPRKGKTWEEIYGLTGAQKMRKSQEKKIGRKDSAETIQKKQAARLGKTYEEVYGPERALEVMANMSRAQKGRVKSESHREKIAATLRGKPGIWIGKKHSEESKRKMREVHLGVKKSEETRRKMRENWQSPEYVQKQMTSRHVTPNKAEMLLQSLLNQIAPNTFKYVGDGQFILAGKCPDFLNVNGKKQLIELYGDYWHKGQDPQDRINLFKQYGYDTLVIWERELKNPEGIKNMVTDFLYKEE